MLVGLLLVPVTEDGRFSQEARTLTEDCSEEDTDPFAAFCEKSGAIRFMILRVQIGDKLEQAYYPVVDPVFSDFGTAFSDDGVSFRGTLLLTKPDTAAVEFNWFCVYQKSDGSLYTQPTMGASIGNGDSMTRTNREEYTETVDGETKTSYRELVLTMQSVNVPAAYELLAFDASHVLLERTTYAPDEIPEALRLPDGTAYVLVECREIGEYGPTVSRTIYQLEDYGFHPYCDRGDGLCETQYCEFFWPQ